ncbi:MAG: SusC/RagA family TonB-linked outer membrane protein, partial [Muribaculaceae bacterium]|nr:SusC/RagA family TonB-linked outer membrane protein [Muribaculaceae bacterium]
MAAVMALAFCAPSAWAAPTTVTGTVLDNEGLEVIGGVVEVKGTKTKVITDVNGAYAIQVDKPRKAVLVFSYLGCEPKEEQVNGRTKIDVVLKPSMQALDEVVVIGYATVKRKDLTGSVSSVKGAEMMKTPGGDATQALAGRMSGVQIVQSDGQPGATPSVRVRGGISITQDNSPLYIIDGVPNEDGMSNVNPNDIESIDVLKDASATAIYGARGANGVVLVTTKSGSDTDGKATVSFDAYVGWRKLANKLQMLSTEEFVLADYERTIGRLSTAPEDGGMNSWQQRYGGFADIHANYGDRPGIDWLDRTMGRTTLAQSYRLTVSGGSKKLNYYMSYGYYNDEGAMIHSGSDKHSISANIRSDVSKRLSINGRINYDVQTITGAGVAGNGTNTGGSNVDARFNKLAQILAYRPTIGIRGNDSELLYYDDPILQDDSGNTLVNPVRAAGDEKDDRKIRTVQAVATLTFKLGRGWTFRSTEGTRYQNTSRSLFYGPNSILGRRSGIYGSVRKTEAGSFSTSNVLSYDKRIKKTHHIMLQFGQEYVKRWTQYVETGVRDLPTDDFGLNDMVIGTPSAASSYFNDDDHLLSFFARANYDYKSKYIFTATFRADGSSKFGKNNKWG